MKAFESDIFASSSMLGERWKLAKSQHDRIHTPPEVSSNSQKYTPKSRFSQENVRMFSSNLRKKENAYREAIIHTRKPTVRIKGKLDPGLKWT